MKGIVFDIKRFAVHDGPGIRTTVFFKGCPLRCWWCHNPESIDRHIVNSVKHVVVEGKVFDQKEQIGREYSVDELTREILRDQMFMDESGGGVTFSGGDPTLQPAFLEAVLKRCKKYGIHTAVDTSGFCSGDVIEKIAPFTDLFLFDLKHFDHEKHIQYTGVSNKIILDNLNNIISKGKEVIIRIPVIPGVNYEEKERKSMISLLSQIGRIKEVHLLPYHTIASNKYKRFGMENKMKGIPALNKSDLKEYKQELEQAGFKVKIGG
ncbi:MAG: glycyl-radical enzyme activating protein [Bacteroidota bacterium]|nr:glycyl-radical enzyme activating protein [Bacteroidota bacterium]MDP4206155.1 glycyl-radical enzyme activating protein [Bacteroidota bacterium]